MCICCSSGPFFTHRSFYSICSWYWMLNCWCIHEQFFCFLRFLLPLIDWISWNGEQTGIIQCFFFSSSLYLDYFTVECCLFTVFHGRRIVLCCTMCKCAIHSLDRRLVDVEILVSFVSGFNVTSPFIFLQRNMFLSTENGWNNNRHRPSEELYSYKETFNCNDWQLRNGRKRKKKDFFMSVVV